MKKSVTDKSNIVEYIKKYKEEIRQGSGSYSLKEINEELFPALKALNQGDKIYYVTERKQVSLLNFLQTKENRECSVIILTGEGGMGKTVSMIATTEELCNEIENVNGRLTIPIYIPLYCLNDIEQDNLISTYMLEEIWEGDKEAFDYFIKTNNLPYSVVFLLDGFNELRASIKKNVGQEIRRLISRNRGKILISSRSDSLLNLPVFHNMEDDVSRLEIQPLSVDQIEEYLKACDMDYPENNDRLQAVLSNPLMLMLYSNSEKYKNRERGTRRFLSWYYEPTNAGQIIWNFLQAQVLKIWHGERSKITIFNGYIAIHFVSAFIGYKMELDQSFSISRNILKLWIKELHSQSDILHELINELYGKGIEELFFEESDSEWELVETNIMEILTSGLSMFISTHEGASNNEMKYEPCECKMKFMHQQFRDCYAAIYRKYIMLKKEWYLDDAWSKPIRPNIIRFCSDLFSKEELKDSVKELRKKQFEKDNVVLINILNISKIVFQNDFSEFDFSYLDLRKIYLGGLKFGPRTQFKNTQIDFNTFLPEGHEGKVNAVSILKSAEFGVSGGEDGNLILWNLETGRCEKKFKKKYGNITKIDSCIKLDENGEECDFILVGNKQGKVVEINISKDKESDFGDFGSKIVEIFYNPKTPQECAILLEEGKIFIYDLLKQIEKDTFDNEQRAYCGAYTPNGQAFAMGLETGVVKIWNMTKEEPLELKSHNVAVRAMAFSINGDYLVTGANEGKIIIYRKMEHDYIFIREVVCDKNVLNIKFFPCFEKEKIFVYSTNGIDAARNMILQYDIDGQDEQILSYYKHLIYDIDFAPDGKKYATVSYDTTVRCWDVKTGLCAWVLQGSNSWIRSIAFASNGLKCVLGSYDNSLKIWDVVTERCCKTPYGHEHWVRDIEYLGDKESFVSVSYDKTLRIWNKNGKYQCINVFKEHEKGISGVSCSRDGKYCVTASYDKNVILWNLLESNTNENHQILEGHSGRVRDIAYSPYDDICVSASYDKTLIVWDCTWGFKGNRKIKVLDRHTDYVRCVTFTANGKYCISGSYDKTFIVWDVQNWKMKYQSTKFPEWIRCLDCSPDGETLLVGCDNGTIYVWNIEDNRKKGQLDGHENWIGKVKFFPDGKSCISCSDDNSIKIWNMEVGENQYKCKNTYRILPYLDLVDCDLKDVIIDRSDIEHCLDNILYVNGALIKMKE